MQCGNIMLTSNLNAIAKLFFVVHGWHACIAFVYLHYRPTSDAKSNAANCKNYHTFLGKLQTYYTPNAGIPHSHHMVDDQRSPISRGIKPPCITLPPVHSSPPNISPLNIPNIIPPHDSLHRQEPPRPPRYRWP